MAIAIMPLLLLVLVMIGGVALQIFLSKRESKWAGLILPIITFVISLLAVLASILGATVGVGSSTVTNLTTGEIISQTTVTPNISYFNVFLTSLYVFVLGNIPTLILLAIYAVCRKSRKKNRELDMMRAQELE